jgi:hypothetical protein
MCNSSADPYVSPILLTNLKKKEKQKHRSFPFRFHWQEVRLLCLRYVQTLSRAHSIFCSVGTTGSLPEDKVDGAWIRLLYVAVFSDPIHVCFLHYFLGAGLQSVFIRKRMQGSGDSLQSFNLLRQISELYATNCGRRRSIIVCVWSAVLQYVSQDHGLALSLYWNPNCQHKLLLLRYRVQNCKKYFFVIKPTKCTNFTNWFSNETLHVPDSSSVHHQEFIHCTLSNGICHTCL